MGYRIYAILLGGLIGTLISLIIQTLIVYFQNLDDYELLIVLLVLLILLAFAIATVVILLKK